MGTDDSALVEDNYAVDLATELPVVSCENDGPLFSDLLISQVGKDGVGDVGIDRAKYIVEEDNVALRIERPMEEVDHQRERHLTE